MSKTDGSKRSSPAGTATPFSATTTARGGVRRVRMRTSGATLQHLPGGVMLVKPEEYLQPYPKVLTDRLAHWAKVSPEKICIARRGATDEWTGLTYSQVWESVRCIGQALLDRGLSAERPVAIISENDLEHYLLMLAGQHVGIPTAAISPSYSLVSKDFGKLRHCMKILTPGLVFASDGQRYAPAIESAVDEHAEVIATSAPPDRRNSGVFASLLQTNPTGAIREAHEKIRPDDVAKFLFTSGSTALPKAVINTHRMICSNQQQIAQLFGFLQDDPPVILDWLPWNHTFGGNHDIGIALYNGGTFYIDDGKPGPGWIEKTVRNLRQIPTTIFFNVPKGYEDLLPFLRTDRELRESFFRRLGMMFYAGAGLSQPVWDAYRQLAFETCGERIIMATGLGSTETSPMAIQTTWETDRAGTIGIPVPGVELKLVPHEGKLEARVRGPNITPGYWRQPELTAKVFDDEGFYSFGDAVKLIDPSDVNKGLLFDGRLTEDFKLANGTWVSVGPLRAKMIAHCAPFLRDAVIAGLDRDFLSAILFVDADACRSLTPELPKNAPLAEIVANEKVRERFSALLKSLAQHATGSSNRVARAALADELPSLDAGEITDKGSFNQRVVLERRSALIAELYATEPSPRILRV
ncbi:MAG TPA: feruloyl-CoA synthase [Candidatus Dormibacteraeota bacterium]|nr:feruloyl-CoA synthase [Candidatus Dormibacteraeota bacterium]